MHQFLQRATSNAKMVFICNNFWILLYDENLEDKELIKIGTFRQKNSNFIRSRNVQTLSTEVWKWIVNDDVIHLLHIFLNAGLLLLFFLENCIDYSNFSWNYNSGWNWNLALGETNSFFLVKKYNKFKFRTRIQKQKLINSWLLIT